MKRGHTINTDELSPLDRLTPRQLECLRLVRDGLSAKHVARELGISHRTVEFHLTAAIERLQAGNRLGAVMMLSELENSKAEVETASARQPAPFMLVSDHESNEVDLIEKSPEEGRQSHIPPVGGKVNDLTVAARLKAILTVASVSILVVAGLILTIAGAIHVLSNSS